MKIKIFFIVCALFCLSITSSAMTVDEVPNPQTTASTSVQDSAGVLGPEYSALIDSIANQLKTATGAEMAVVTVDNLGGTTVEDFAERLFKRFGIGVKGKDNGILILFALGDRKVRIEVGYGLEGTINDAKAGRFLDTYAVPRFKTGEYARGLFETARAVASEAATADNAKLSISDPAQWPAQATPPEPVATAASSQSGPLITSSQGALIGTAIIVGFYLLGLLILWLRVSLKKAKAAKQNSMGSGVLLPTLTWFIGIFGIFVIVSGTGGVFIPIASMVGAMLAATLVHVKVRSALKSYIANYRLSCPSCHKPMDLVGEFEDDKFLKKEEIAEEKAGGMDYEFWHCVPCDKTEHLEVKLPKASKCPKCNRRALKAKTTVLTAATYSSSGLERIDQDCINCGYHHEQERKIPKLTQSSSGSSSGGFSSGSSSFGGGSSGGGGSSRSW